MQQHASAIEVVHQEDASDHPAANTPEAIAQFEQRARERTNKVKALLQNGTLISAADLYVAAFVLQHGETADDYLLAHVLASDSLAKGNEMAKWLVGATLDRYLQLMGRPQIFGTQYPLDPAKPHPVSADGRGRFTGRTQEPYSRMFVTEQIRADFCVPALAQQQQNLDILNSGKYPDAGMQPAGCKR